MSKQMTDDERAQALLSYSDALYIYHDFDKKHKQKEVCYANIGEVMV